MNVRSHERKQVVRNWRLEGRLFLTLRDMYFEKSTGILDMQHDIEEVH